ncbi:TPA: hypothetical protein OV749_001364 [Acinetobacter baumannii]|nr:hypothetical protein [Acinetobacter baumannii]
MSDNEVEKAVIKVFQEGINEQKNLVQNNEELKNNILADIDSTIKYLNELKSGKHITSEALKDDPDLLNNNIPIIKSCLNQAITLRSLVDSIKVDHDDLGYLSTLRLSLQNIQYEYYEENFFLLPKNLGNTHASLIATESFLRTLYSDKARYNSIIKSQIDLMLKDAQRELEDFKELKNILKNLKTEDYYSKESKKYKTTHYIYLGLFIVTLIGALCISAYSICAEPKFYLEPFDYWFIKISFILVVITLVSFFIKQSSHYQSLADQANQTRLEIQAFPTFVTGIEKEDEVAIRKELALKYFGREVDKTAHKDMSNLVSDQMRNTTEMVKAVTEVIKKP